MSPPLAEPEVFFTINPSRLTLTEFRFYSGTLSAVLTWMFARLGIKLPNSTDDPNVPDLRPYRVAFSQFPPEIAERFSQKLPELVALGFRDFVFHRVVDVNNSTWIYTATAAHSSGTAWVRLHNRIWTTPNPRRDYFFPMFLTRFTDGSWLWSSAGKPDLLAPKECITQFATGATASALWDRHRSRLESLSVSKSASPVHGPVAALEAAERHHAVVAEFHLKRGVFVRPSLTQAKSDEDLRRILGQASQMGVRNPEVLVELEKLQTAKGGWGNAWIVLIVSLILFLGAGRSQWSWNYVLLLLPVLFIHEAGHWVAMKAFGYRNLKMFFIPFFGAAVSGVNYNVPGWKKAIVSLAGPVPGIILGFILGITGLISGNELLIKSSLVSLLLNGFNLIPVLPLDGGWVVHTTLFCRNPIIDVCFRALAGLGLAGIGMFSGDKILMYLSIPSFIRLPIAYKLSKIAHQLRREGIISVSEDARTVPPAAADEIAARLKVAMPKGVNAKAYAQFTLEIFETLNARAPGWLATCTFLLVQVGCFGAAALLAIFLFIGKGGALGGFLAAAAMQPTTPISCTGVETADKHSADTGARTVILTKLDSEKAAKTAFAGITGELPEGTAAARIGQSIVFSHPSTNDALRKTWFARFERLSTNTFVSASNQIAGFRLAAIAKTKEDAERIAKEFRESSSAGGIVVPPWSTEDPRTPPVKDQQARAARTIALLQERFDLKAKADPKVKELGQARAAALRRGETAEAERITRELQQLDELRRETRFKTILATNQGRIDDEVVALMQKQERPGFYTNRTEVQAVQRALTGRLGAEVQPGSKPGYRQGIRNGFVQQESLLLLFDWVSFEDPAVGIAPFLEWLCAAGVKIEKYDITDPSRRFDRLGEDE